MPSRRSSRQDQAHLVTEARPSRSAEIGQRERRYLIMMGLRVVFFVITVVLFLNHVGWFSLLPAAGAILLPYFAVVVANARQQTSGGRFRSYEPQLPERYVPPPDDGSRPGSGG